MSRWSINLFRVRGIQISLHPTFFLPLAFVCFDGWNDWGTGGLFWEAAMYLAFCGCIVLHELGHSFAGMWCGVSVRRILMTLVGGIAEFEQIPREPGKELLISIAGPLVNFVVAGVLWSVVGSFRLHDLQFAQFSVRTFAQVLLVGNIVLGLFNLLPAFPMDGGRIVRALLATKLPYVRATFWATILAKIVLISLAVYALYEGFYAQPLDSSDRSNEIVHLPILCLVIWVLGEMEYRALKRSDKMEAEWLESLNRHYGKPPSEKPPVLTT